MLRPWLPMTPRRLLLIGAVLCFTGFLLAFIVAWIDRWAYPWELFHFAGDCIYRDGACSGAFATWGVVVVSIFTLMAAGVAALYTRQAALSAGDAAAYTKQLAEETVKATDHARQLSELEHRLVARFYRCPLIDAHKGEEPVAVYVINDNFKIEPDDPSGDSVFDCLFEVRNIGRSPILDFTVNLTLHLENDSAGKPTEIQLGDVGPSETVHFLLRSRAHMVGLPDVRISFSGGVSRDGEVPRPVHVTGLRHRVNFMNFNMNVLPSQ
jgi:hypothetical protein